MDAALEPRACKSCGLSRWSYRSQYAIAAPHLTRHGTAHTITSNVRPVTPDTCAVG